MHIIIGHSADPLCGAVLSGMAKCGFKARILELAISDSQKLDLRIDVHGDVRVPEATLRLDEADKDVESVLVRSTGFLDPAGWSASDHAYVQSENQAALLAWLTALDCPVVNRVGADLWYRPQTPLAYWLPRLARAGLTVPSIRITTDPAAARAFRRELEADALPGAVCVSFVQGQSWLVGPTDWAGIEKLQALAPVCLIEPHQTPRSVCIVGGEVIWDIPPGKTLARLTASLERFARIVGLDFVELVLGRVGKGWAVVNVDPLPQLLHFETRTQTRIVAALIDLLQGTVARNAVELEVAP